MAGFCTAFTLYSALPVPRVEWNRHNMRYALCFFPLIGAVVGAAGWGWLWLCTRFQVSPALFAAVATLLPAILTGGIHLDGFIDTADAISSHAAPERKLEILKDSHAGAFGILYLAGYLLLSFGLWWQLYATPACVELVFVGYAISRCANPLSIATFPTARSSGLVHLFADSADKRAVVICTGLVGALLLAFCVVRHPLWGTVLAVCTALCFLLHRRFCLREFGGNTGDLAGFLLQKLELLTLAVAALGGIIF